VATGYFRDNNPLLKLKVSTPDSSERSREYECVIDTGYTGFLSLPFMEMIWLGLTPHTATWMRFANGAREPRLICLGAVYLDGKQSIGDITMEPNADESLVGIEFLRIFQKSLHINPMNGIIELRDHP